MWLLALSAFLLAEPTLASEPLVLTATAFGRPVAIEVRDLPATEAEVALRAALAEIHEVEALTSPEGTGDGGLAALNAAAGAGSRPGERRLVELLARAREFCLWSRGAHGPLGGRLYRLWGLRAPVEALPASDALAAAVASGGCDGVRVDPPAGRVELAADRRLDLHGFEVGFAVDRAVTVLRERGAADGKVAVGGVVRGFGPGPGGAGWRVELPTVEGYERPLDDVRLTDQALAVAAAGDRPLEIAGERFAPFFDQRTGRPVAGVVATVAVTELAVDAEALAVAMFVIGNREGSLRLGTLKPTPAVLWLLGSGTGAPVLMDYHWSKVRLKQ